MLMHRQVRQVKLNAHDGWISTTSGPINHTIYIYVNQFTRYIPSMDTTRVGPSLRHKLMYKKYCSCTIDEQAAIWKKHRGPISLLFASTGFCICTYNTNTCCTEWENHHPSEMKPNKKQKFQQNRKLDYIIPPPM